MWCGLSFPSWTENCLNYLNIRLCMCNSNLSSNGNGIIETKPRKVWMAQESCMRRWLRFLRHELLLHWFISLNPCLWTSGMLFLMTRFLKKTQAWITDGYAQYVNTTWRWTAIAYYRPTQDTGWRKILLVGRTSNSIFGCPPCQRVRDDQKYGSILIHGKVLMVWVGDLESGRNWIERLVTRKSEAEVCEWYYE